MKFKLIKQDGVISINGVKTSPTIISAEDIVKSTPNNFNHAVSLRNKNLMASRKVMLC